MPLPAISVWDTKESDFPEKGRVEEKLACLLNYAIMAPSGHNTQPWLFRITGNTVELYADRTRALPVVDPGDRELTISCGAALFNLKTAIRHIGYLPSIEIFPAQENPDLLAKITHPG